MQGLQDCFMLHRDDPIEPWYRALLARQVLAGDIRFVFIPR